MTNGGGVLEATKAQQLSEWLQVSVAPEQVSASTGRRHWDQPRSSSTEPAAAAGAGRGRGGGRGAAGLTSGPRLRRRASSPVCAQVILSHTPMRALAAQYAHRPVLVSGRHDVLRVARAYGFSQALSTRQLGAAYPTATPFSAYPGGHQQGQQGQHQQQLQQHHQRHHQQHQELCPVKDLGWGTEEAPIAAVLVMHDPDDWSRDLQLLTDVLLTRGVPTRLAAPEGAPPVALYFSNADLLWANEFPRWGAIPGAGRGAAAASSSCRRASSSSSSSSCSSSGSGSGCSSSGSGSGSSPAG
jgi:ribonucleotide monophosphatase NagD (HAD superfamily)